MSCDPCEVYCYKERIARKDHQCAECDGVIRAGETYHYHHGIFDGAPFSHKVCWGCEVLRKIIDKDVRDISDCIGFGQLSEHMLNTDNINFVNWFIDIKIARGAIVSEALKTHAENLFSEKKYRNI